MPGRITACLLVLAVLLMEGRLDRRFWLPIALLASTAPHALLVYHAAPIEIARHSTTLMLVLVTSCVWIFALSLDEFADRWWPAQGGGSTVECSKWSHDMTPRICSSVSESSQRTAS